MTDDSEKPDFKLLAGGFGNTSDAGVEKFKRAVPGLIAMLPLMAKMRKAYFEALKAEGFTEAQALDLTRDFMKGM